MPDLIECVSGPISLTDVIVASTAVLGLPFALRQIRVAQEINAQDAYQEYHHLSLNNPRYAFGIKNISELDEREAQHYQLFVMSMLLTVERIVTLFPNDKQWRAAVQDDIEMHLPLILSDGFKKNRSTLSASVLTLIKALEKRHRE